MVVLGLDRVTIYPAYGVSWLPEAYEFATDYTEDDAAVGQMQFADIDALVASSYATFSRATAGVAETLAGELVNFAANEPRITDRGILVEGAATNNIARSRDFNSGYWAAFYQKPTFITGIHDPFGANNASRFNASDVTGGPSNNAGGILKTPGSAPYADGDAITVSIWARASQPIDVRFGAQALATYTLTTEWQRLTFNDTFNASNGKIFHFDAQSNEDVDIDIYGAQSEAGLYASSYIDSDSGSATTRAADELTLSLESAITSGLFLAEFEAGNGWGIDGSDRRIFQAHGDSYKASLGSISGNSIKARIVDDSNNALLNNANLGAVSGTIRAALRVDSGNHAAFASGKTKATSASVGVTTISELKVGYGGGFTANTYIKSIALVDPDEWTDTEIQNWVDSV